ncbi:MAG: DUF2177 family protein [Chitinophagales bacterium]
MRYLLLYLVALITLFVLDGLWLGLIAKKFNYEKLGFLLAEQPRWSAAIVFYLLYAAGILFFCTRAAIDAASLQTALLHGAALGLLCYGTFDLTCAALVKNWPLIFSVVDMIWGTVMTAMASTVLFYASKWM